jgi:hypothetical protein
LSEGYYDVWGNAELVEMARASEPFARKLVDAMLDSSPSEGFGETRVFVRSRGETESRLEGGE